MRFLDSVKALYAAVIILCLTVGLDSYVNMRNEAMHARHLEISTGLERMVRLNQELTGMLVIAALEQSTLRTASYDSLNSELEAVIQTVTVLTSKQNLSQEIAALSEGRAHLHAIEQKAMELMRADKWEQARATLSEDTYVLARKTYEIDSDTAVGAVTGELAATAQRFGRIRNATFGVRIGAMVLLVWVGVLFSRRTRADLAEQVRLRDELAAANEELEERVRKRTEELSAANRMLEATQHKIVQSIHYARIIQTSMLPDQELRDANLGEHLVIYRPKDIVGGDFYYLRQYPDHFLLAVIDCTGHGIPGAFMTMTVNSVLNRVVDLTCNNDPSRILSELNRVLQQTLKMREVDAGLDIALCLVERTSGRLVYAGAGLSLFAVVGGELREIRGDRQRVGYKGSRLDFSYVNHELRLAPGDACYLTSDGILDHAGGAKGYGFGTERFMAMLAAHAGLPMPEQAQRFEQILCDYQGDYPQRDDVTLIGFRF
ncbi:SpoIIE family protein phosphatase [Trichlorobacter ammonificans]|uniref:Phosphoserine phosphatase n=1 Tax=Trichlorobacter ammonificans TaxID=2916410 RepID=A0ABM9D472_9BACT|nr:SpoIIE family protein phosphatase [Trichlorobacter ammonificans]CAH2030042.1 putative Phosphoserine phosphatase [Trichlorobacter ammonificans]